MTRRVAGVTIIAAEPPQQCDDCGQIRELRPYGPKGSAVCFECAKKDPVALEIGMLKMLGIRGRHA